MPSGLIPDQDRQLRTLLSFREVPPTMGWYWKSSRKIYVLLVFLCVGGAAFYYWNGWLIVSGFFCGTLFGVILRDAGWHRRHVRSWPLSQEIINWRRVDELIGHDS